MAETIRVVILEDHASIVDGYQLRLGRSREIEIVAALSFGEELEPTLASLRPIHLLLLDINVPTSPSNSNPYPILQLMPKLLDFYPDLHILVISMHKQRPLIKAVVRAGASGYILKDDREAIENLDSVVRTVARDGIHFSREAHQQLLRQATDTLPLTRRQIETISLCSAYPDKTSSEISDLLGVADTTVRNQLSVSYAKLGVHSRTALVEKARALGLIVTPEVYPANIP